MDKNSYLDGVGDALLKLEKERGKYWTRDAELVDQIRIIKEAAFLNDEMKNAIEEKRDTFNGDIWRFAEKMVEIFYNKNANLPSVDVFAVFVRYVFYEWDLLDLSAI